MAMLGLILLIAALVCFVLAAFNLVANAKINLVAAGLALLAAYWLVMKVGG